MANPRVDGSSPQALSTPKADGGARSQPAVAGGMHSVEEGGTLWKMAEQAYGDGNKWTLIRDDPANAGKVKMRGDIPIIQIGASLKVPQAPEGWAPRTRSTGSHAVPVASHQVPAQGTSAAPRSAGEAYGNVRQSLDKLEFQLQGLAPHQRDTLETALRSGAPVSPELRGAPDLVGGTMHG